MDNTFQFPPSSGLSAPLFPISPERANQRPQSSHSSIFDESPKSRHTRESSIVSEKVAVFNSLAYQGKQLERKTNDAALKRAMLGREEAESEMRRYKEECRSLRRQVEEGRERERRVGERLEGVMDNYGRAKETHAHTQALWEKEIRRARKESFKSQSVIVKLQEELKSNRNMLKLTQSDLEAEKERSKKREQEAFAARYQLVGVQEELSQMAEKIKLVEQERDALRMIAKNEEIARIAAEGQLPLPAVKEDDEFASPKKARKSLDPVLVTSSAAAEEELNDLRQRLEWEQLRADRAHERVEFLEMECKLNCCASKTLRPSTADGPKLRAPSNAIFIPSEGVFRTVSHGPEESPWISPAKKTIPIFEQAYQPESRGSAIPMFELPQPTRLESQAVDLFQRPESRTFARTPSCDPPAYAIPSEANTSLLSLLDEPQPEARSEPQEPESESENNTTIIQTTSEDSISPEGVTTTMIKTFHTVSRTTRIPLANPPDLTPTNVQLPASLNPALSPTMSREEALAMIRERRGRARSLAQGTTTPKRQMGDVTNRRDISAPAIRSGGVRGRAAARVI